MKRGIPALLLALLLLGDSALAEVRTGSTVAADSVAVAMESGGTLTGTFVEVGDRVEAAEELAQLRSEKVYAAADGTVARIEAEEGEAVDGTVLELAGVSRYTIHCSVAGAYRSAASTRVRIGEELFLRCKVNGTHRGTGVVIALDGEEYRVAATGGAFYVGEVVQLYRDDAFTAAQRVGAGTVVSADPQAYEAQGYLTRLHVEEGEYVERGELLFEYTGSRETFLTAPVSGIVTEASDAGTALQAQEIAFRIVTPEQIQVEIAVDETAAAKLRVGDAVALIYADDPTETPVGGRVCSVSRLAQDELYTVRIRPDTPPQRLGLTVRVRTPDAP